MVDYAPRQALARGGLVKAVNTPDSPVLSAVNGDNSDLLAEAAKLWIHPQDLIIDTTYGRGVFWRQLAQPHIRHDIALDGVDCRALPEPDSVADVVVFDPPYRANHGGSLNAKGGMYLGYRLEASGLETINDVLDLYRDGIKEAFRVLVPGGRILVKCADLSYSSRLHLVHVDILQFLTLAGFELADMFLLANTARMPHNGKVIRQERARRSHSYLLVGAKPSA